MSHDSLPLPSYRHLPGQNPRPDADFLDTIIEQASALTTDKTASTNVAWLYGLRLIDEGYYWEAHEVLEAVWNNAAPNSRERHLVQAVIQIANARLKTSLQQSKAANRLTILARESIERAFGQKPATVMGLDIVALVRMMGRKGDAKGSDPKFSNIL